MQARPLGATGVKVSEVGLGCWQIGGAWGDVPEDDARAVLQAAVDGGVTFFDTADVYGGGRSERLIGGFLRNSQADVFVATKLGRGGDPGGEANLQLDVMRRHAEESRERLQVESLDLIQLHCVPTEALRRGHVFDHLRTLQSEGLIKHFGASVESMEEAHICLQHDDLASLQIIFNIYRQKPIWDLFDAAKANGVALIVRLPLASGLLSGKYTKGTTFAEDDHRNFNADGQMFNVGETFAGLPFERGVDVAEKIKPLVPQGITTAQFALRWILDHDAVSVVIPGARNGKQVKDNVAAGDLAPLPEKVHEELRELYEQEIAAHIRGPY